MLHSATTSVPIPSRRRRLDGLAQRLEPYVMVAPAVLFMAAAVVYPLLFSLVVSFKEFSLTTGLNPFEMPSAGWDNFSTVIHDPVFVSSAVLTGKIAGVAFVVELVLGFALALAVDTVARRRPDRLYTTLILTPLMLAPIAASLIWRMLLDTQYGFVNAASAGLGLGEHAFLAEPSLAVASVILVDVWQWTPFVFLIFLAALRAIPEELREAAMVDGASAWALLRKLLLPMLRWAILLVVLIRGTDLLRTFDYVYGLTFGGPGYATETSSFYAYLTGFQNFDLGRGAAASWLIFLVIYVSALLLLASKPAREAWS